MVRTDGEGTAMQKWRRGEGVAEAECGFVEELEGRGRGHGGKVERKN